MRILKRSLMMLGSGSARTRRSDKAGRATICCGSFSGDLLFLTCVLFTLLAALMVGGATKAFADQRMNTTKAETTNFSAGFAAPLPKEIWDKSISEPAGKFILLRSWDDKKEAPDAEDTASQQAENPLTPAEESEPEGKELAMVDENRESIIERYGDPKERVVITPDQKAPKPFKGIHAALQIGDEQLAFDYARKHVRYMAEFENRAGNLQGLIAKAMEKGGLRILSLLGMKNT